MFRSLSLAVGFLIALLGPAASQDSLETYRASVESRKSALEQIEKSVATDGSVSYIELRKNVRDIRIQSQMELAPIEEARNALKEELTAIGSAPADTDAPEAASLAEDRKRISARLSLYEAALRQADLNIELANRVLADISAARTRAFYGDVFRKGASPLEPEVLSIGASGFVSGLEGTSTAVREYTGSRKAAGTTSRDLMIASIAILAAFLLFFPIRRWLNRKISATMSETEPTHARRAIAAAARTAARIVPGLIGGAILYSALGAINLINESTASIAQAVWIAFLSLLAVDGAATAVLSPHFTGWRIIPLRSSRAYLVRAMLIAATAVIGIDFVLRVGAPIVDVPQETALLQSAIVALVLSVLIVLLTRQSIWQLEAERAGEISEGLLRNLGFVRFGGLVVGAAAIIAVLIGYVALGYFAATRILFLFGLVAAWWCVRGLVREVLTALGAKLSPVTSDSDDEPRGSLIVVWLGLILDLIIMGSFAVPAFVVLGADWTEVRDIFLDAFFGFKIGSVTISIADLLAAVFVFVVIIAITRFIQRSAETKLFPHLRVDPGVQHSFRTLIGYAGIIVAFLSAVGAIGFDLSNLAIVAGALSVGIGFGLQSIVSNFVSGLILLFERPIKVGDWIVVPSGEGYVRRISVRSTEIETFDRSSVIVPNSELITGTVTNLTHGDKIGRIIVPVGVSYNEDPDSVIAILKDIAWQHPKCLRTPEPFVYFFGFGDSSIDFELRVFVRDISQGILIRNDLRLSIFKRFRAEGIEIPFPQRVLHVMAQDSQKQENTSLSPQQVSA